MAYCTKEDLEFIFGKTNVKVWCDPDNNNDSLAIQKRLDYAITQATDYVNDRLSTTRYSNQLPYPDDAVPSLVMRMTALQTGIYLNDNRGFNGAGDQDGIDHMVQYRSELSGLWQSLIYGTIGLFTSSSDKITYPTTPDATSMAVTETERVRIQRQNRCCY